MIDTWVLVVLTLAGGYTHDASTLADCTRQLLKIRTTNVREAYCMGLGPNDKAYRVRRGKLEPLE